MKKSFFQKEVDALEKFLASRDKLDAPVIGDEDFDEVVAFYAYACRLFGLRLESVRDMVLALVPDTHRDQLSKTLENQIGDHFAMAEEVDCDDRVEYEKRFTPFGFKYVRNPNKG